MKCTGASCIIIHLQQGKVLIVYIKCVGVNFHCTSHKQSLHDTNIMHSIMAYIKHTHITQGLL